MCERKFSLYAGVLNSRDSEIITQKTSKCVCVCMCNAVKVITFCASFSLTDGTCDGMLYIPEFSGDTVHPTLVFAIGVAIYVLYITLIMHDGKNVYTTYVPNNFLLYDVYTCSIIWLYTSTN